MAEANSPLRYPGGKAILSDFLAEVVAANGIQNCIYAEPYAGGAGAAINLLLAGKVDRIMLNDADRSIWAFWTAILNNTKEFLELLEKTPVTVDQWAIQRQIYASPKNRTVLELGFAAFYLNRCNRSGILTGGIIGGVTQKGKWKIDARYNRAALKRRVERIAAFSDKISVTNLDAVQFLQSHLVPIKDRSNLFVYLDPPYFEKGSRLYLNSYAPEDHAVLSSYLKRLKRLKWIVTYDNIDEIRNLYKWCKINEFNLRYSAHSSRKGAELLISAHELRIPLSNLV